MAGVPTILVADDHPLFRSAVAYALRDAFGEVDIIQAANAASIEASVAEHPELGLVLLDLLMPGARGLSMLVRLRGERPDVPIIVVSSSDHPRTIRRVQQFGAAGFVPKSASADEIADSVRTVLDGGSWFPTSLIERSEADSRLATQLAQLTPQQFRVLMCLSEGLLNKEIAWKLGLAENTVKVHVTAILKKLECASRTQAALLVKALEADSEL